MTMPLQTEIFLVLLGLLLVGTYGARWIRSNRGEDRLVPPSKRGTPHWIILAVGLLFWGLGGGWPSTWEMRPEAARVMAHPRAYDRYLKRHIRAIDPLVLVSIDTRERLAGSAYGGGSKGSIAELVHEELQRRVAAK